MFEGGAAWAVKQNSTIGLAYKNYDKEVPSYLKTMKKMKIDCSSLELTRDRYTNIINMLNSIIEYLNRNYVDDASKKSVLSLNLPTDIELANGDNNIEDYYNSDIVTYWNYYVLKDTSKNNL